ncbi:hypothetical protein CORC01_09212, partial [Colletotrichum orchidophilum]
LGLHQSVSPALFCVGPHSILRRGVPPLVRVDKEALLLVHVRFCGLYSANIEHRTPRLPFSSQLQDEVPYLHCTCATRHRPLQPQLTPRPPPKLAPEPSSATPAVQVTRSAAQPQCVTAHGMIGRPSLAASCPHRRCGSILSTTTGTSLGPKLILARCATRHKGAVASVLG